jgi:hypothetical protein
MAEMDMLERRIREVVATLLAKGAKVLERTAGELANAASELRPDRGDEDTERAWAEESDDDVQPITRGAPLRAVPDRPTDEDDGEYGTPSDALWTPPAEPPEGSDAERPGDVDAVVTTSSTVASGVTGTTDRLDDLATGTVSQIRPQLGELSPDELGRLKEIELANRKRSTLIAAIDRALTDNA